MNPTDHPASNCRSNCRSDFSRDSHTPHHVASPDQRQVNTPRTQQRGVALVVALILLLLITIIGLAAVSGTIMQSKMAANQYDRQQAFQNAASALRIAQQQILANPGAVYRDCSPTGKKCLANPFENSQITIQTVQKGNAAGQYTAGKLTTGQPQYVIQGMGTWVDPRLTTGYGRTANSHQAGSRGAPSTALYYRITARSGDPKKIGSRATVTLQAVVKRD